MQIIWIILLCLLMYIIGVISGCCLCLLATAGIINTDEEDKEVPPGLYI